MSVFNTKEGLIFIVEEPCNFNFMFETSDKKNLKIYKTFKLQILFSLESFWLGAKSILSLKFLFLHGRQLSSG